MSKTSAIPGSVNEMVAVALPMVVSFACDTFMIFTDRLFLAKLSPQSMSAVMAGGLSVFMLMSFFLGLIGYTTALVAQYLGAGRLHGCSRTLTQAIIVGVLAYPLILAAIPVVHRLFETSGIDAFQLVEQKKYFNILIFGTIFSLWRQALSGYFTGIGRTRVVMMAALTSAVINVVLNYILVFGKFAVPALGIRGAAVGTVIAGACGVVILASVYWSEKNRTAFAVEGSLKFDPDVMRKLWRFGMPAGFEMLSNITAFTAMVFLFHSEGAVASAAATIVFNWDMVTYVPLMGIEIGVTSVVGRYMGARQIPVVERAVISGLKLGLIYGIVMTVIFVTLPVQLVDAFRPASIDEVFHHARPLAVDMIRLVTLYVIAQNVLIVFIGALRGAGDTLWAMRISMAIHWLIVAVLMVMLKFCHTSIFSAWLALVVIFVCFTTAPYLRYRQGRWKHIRVVEPQVV